MNINNVKYGDIVLIDLTEDTVTADKLYSGYTAHAKDGSRITGTLVPMEALVPYRFDYNIGWVSGGRWTYENPTNTYSDIYEVLSGRVYLIGLGAAVGTRFRAMFTDVDVTTQTSSVEGSGIINVSDPPSYKIATNTYISPSDGYIIISKDNIGTTGLKTYVYDVTDIWL